MAQTNKWDEIYLAFLQLMSAYNACSEVVKRSPKEVSIQWANLLEATKLAEPQILGLLNQILQILAQVSS